MILASILACYFILIIYCQSYDIQKSRFLYTQYCIRRGVLSKRDIVNITYQWHEKCHSYKFFAGHIKDGDRQFISSRVYLSSNGRLYRDLFINGQNTVRFFSYSYMVRQIQTISRMQSIKVHRQLSWNYTVYHLPASIAI